MKTLLCMIAMCLFGFSGFVVAQDKPEKDVKAAANGVYLCAHCKVLAVAPGKCAMCGADMTATHVLAVKDGMAYCCGCGADCKCKPTDDTMTKCSCGKEIVKVSVKGLYVCGCAPDCKCNAVSDKAGKCGCGKDMKKVE